MKPDPAAGRVNATTSGHDTAAAPVRPSEPTAYLRRRPRSAALRRIWYEIRLSWAFIGGDATSMLVPPMLFTAAAWRSLERPWPDLVRSQCFALVFFWCALYVFCLANQATGMKEDQQNKPGRPLVAGQIPVSAAWRRWWWTLGLYLIAGTAFGVALWAAVWLVTTVLYNQGGWARRWYGKNLCIAVATFAQLAAAWRIAGPLTARGWWLIAVITMLFNLVMSVQDLRDLAGDREIGRRTLPMVIGQWPTRIFAAVGLCALPMAAHVLLFDRSAAPPGLVAYEAVLAAVAWLAAVRVVVYRTPASDHRTYLLYTIWYCVLLVGCVLTL
ncbi:UbiA family prenyltransferase [Streptomyces sp. NPDC020379]|uniref:UbiA family prenyltransferase n=1 Tax=Streptomyces sp. NPDC020379 TaxID=3365071 RepID=UPI0037AF05FD